MNNIEVRDGSVILLASPAGKTHSEKTESQVKLIFREEADLGHAGCGRCGFNRDCSPIVECVVEPENDRRFS